MPKPSPHTHSNSEIELLSARGLSCTRGDNALFDGLDLTVKQGQCLHIIGSNGSGKTSLLRILCGLSRADKGHVFWKGALTPSSQASNSHASSETFFAESAYIGHKDGLKNELSALENLRFQQTLEQHSVNEDQLDDCLAKLKILQCADLPAQSLSFGQRRRLAFAKLLLLPKQLWILDEPFTGIDAMGRELIEQYCVEHIKNQGAIVLTHHQSLSNSALSQFKTELHLEKIITNSGER